MWCLDIRRSPGRVSYFFWENKDYFFVEKYSVYSKEIKLNVFSLFFVFLLNVQKMSVKKGAFWNYVVLKELKNLQNLFVRWISKCFLDLSEIILFDSHQINSYHTNHNVTFVEFFFFPIVCFFTTVLLCRK